MCVCVCVCELFVLKLEFLKQYKCVQNKWLLFLNRSSKVSKIGERNRGRPEGSLFNSYYTEV